MSGPASQVDSSARFGGLHVLCDDDPRWPLGLSEQARAACAGGAAVVQLREADLQRALLNRRPEKEEAEAEKDPQEEVRRL